VVRQEGRRGKEKKATRKKKGEGGRKEQSFLVHFACARKGGKEGTQKGRGRILPVLSFSDIIYFRHHAGRKKNSGGKKKKGRVPASTFPICFLDLNWAEGKEDSQEKEGEATSPPLPVFDLASMASKKKEERKGGRR